MKLMQARVLLFTVTLLGMLLLTAGCNNGSQDGDKSKDTIDTTQVVTVTPQDFPVNELADSLFGKPLTVTEEKGLKSTGVALIPVNQAMPEWLDQILSRESIVLFANGILKEMPEEVEFVQTNSVIYDAGEGLKAFVVNFSTRPSNASMIVYGGYMDEARSYWASQSSKEKLEMSVKGAKATADGVELVGEWVKTPKAVPFKAALSKNKSSLVNGK
jgi:hypothetical protein